MARKMIVLAVAFVAFFAAPAAAQYTPTTGTTVPDTTVPDTTVPDTTVPGSTVPGSTVPGSTVPGSTVPGGGTGGTGGGTGSPGATPVVGVGATGSLPRTGADDSTRTIAMVGAGLLAAGGIVLLSVRRRQGAA